MGTSDKGTDLSAERETRTEILQAGGREKACPSMGTATKSDKGTGLLAEHETRTEILQAGALGR